MIKRIFTPLVSILYSFSGFAQTDTLARTATDTLINNEAAAEPIHTIDKDVTNKKFQVYKLNPSIDIPIVAIGTGWSLYAFTKIYNKSAPTDEQLFNLNSANVNGFDRWGIYKYSKSLDVNSYYPFYASVPLPLVLFLSGQNTRRDFWKLTFLYWEAMSVTGLLGTSAAYHVDKFRPFTYSNETSLADKKSHQPKNSFYSGHVELVATTTFLAAKVYSDYYPESKIKWVYYGAASAITLTTGYMRLAGGMHFPSDIILGIGMGAITGILVPQFHKIKNPSYSLLPYTNGEAKGLTFIYHFHVKHKMLTCESCNYTIPISFYK